MAPTTATRRASSIVRTAPERASPLAVAVRELCVHVGQPFQTSEKS